MIISLRLKKEKFGMSVNNKPKSSDRDFFSGEYQFTGRHGDYVKQLTDKLIEKGTYEKDISIIDYNHKFYTIAPMIGFLYKRKSKKENSERGPKISEGQVIRYADRAQETMKLILLLDKDYENNEQKRIDKAFRYFCEDENDFKLFEDYMRGGIEIMYEKIIGEETDPFKIIDNLIDFMTEFQRMFNDRVGQDDIFNLCEAFKKNKAKKSMKK